MKQEEHKQHEDAGMMMAHQAGGAGDPAVDAHAAPHANMAPPPAGAGMGSDVAPNPDHPDQNQDIELFKQLIAQYLGADQTDNDEAMKMCQASYNEAMASGMPHEEAMKCAGYGLKCAHLLTQKEARESMHQAVGGAEPIPPVAMGDGQAVSNMPGNAGLTSVPGTINRNHPESHKQAGMPPPMAKGPMGGGLPPTKAAQSHDASSDGMDKEESHKESSKIKLVAENAQLREANRKLQLEIHLNSLLEKSGMSKKTTTAFRNIVARMKTPVEIDAAWREFKEAFSETSRTSSVPFVFGVEKQSSYGSQAEGSVMSLADCVSKTTF